MSHRSAHLQTNIEYHNGKQKHERLQKHAVHKMELEN